MPEGPRFPLTENAEGEVQTWGLWRTVDGAARWTCAGEAFEVEAGDIVLVRPLTAHEVRPDGDRPWHHWVVMFHARPHWQDWMGWSATGGVAGAALLRTPDAKLRRRITYHWALCHKRLHSGFPAAEALAMAQLEQTLIWCHQALSDSSTDGLDDRISAAMQFIIKHLQTPLDRAEIAQAVNLSESHLADLFRRQVGTAPMQWVEDQRMQRARLLLRTTDASVQTIAFELGFASPYYFSNRFRRHVGLSPRAFRQAQKGPAGRWT